MNNKSELRNRAKIIRKSLDIENISKVICEKIKQTELYKNSEHIMIYYPLKYEINTLFLIDDKKYFYLPKINNEYLDVCPYKQGDKLLISKFGTQEPITAPINFDILDLIILPALMADKNNYRLGYGKGYYDRLLEKTNANTILPIAKELIVDKLPYEKHDKQVDLIIHQ